jgi:Ala-tRNA(Pro) deacylase
MQYHPLTETIQKILDENHIKYDTFHHEPVRTSEEASKVRTGYSIEQGAKALIVRAKKQTVGKVFLMVVVPGDKKFNKEKLKNEFGLTDVRFATEDEASAITNGVQLGGVPPFGNLFGLSVYADKTLLDNERIIFNAGDRSFSIGMKSADYVTVVKPIVGEIV